jgi:hypothetical protein
VTYCRAVTCLCTIGCWLEVDGAEAAVSDVSTDFKPTPGGPTWVHRVSIWIFLDLLTLENECSDWVNIVKMYVRRHLTSTNTHSYSS